MKIRLLLPLLVAAAAQAENFTPDSSVKEVTVYFDRALVTRSASLDLPAGEHTIVFDKLPPGVVDKSLQVSGIGKDVTLADVDLRGFTPAAVEPAAAAEIRAKIETLAGEDGALLNKSKTAQRTLDTLFDLENSWTANAPKSAGDKTPAKTFTPEEIRTFLTFGEEQRLKSLEAIRGLEKQRADNAKERGKLNRELAELLAKRPGGDRLSRVTLRMIAERPTKLSLNLGYSVYGASWGPGYDARLDTKARKINLSYFGRVSNATGEDWSGVTLKLSTARPGLAAQVPQLSGVRYGQFVPVTQTSAGERSLDSRFGSGFGSGGMSKSSSLYQNAFQAPAAAPAEITAAAKEQQFRVIGAEVQNAGVAATFTSPIPAQLPSDNTPHRIALGEVTLPVDLRHELVPSLSESAFLTGKLKNDTGFTFVGGPVSVFINGAFISESRIDTLTPGGVFTLSFGTDDAITVRRKPEETFRETTGITGKYATVTKTWRTVVTNTLETKETLLVREELPISEHEKIEIRPLVPDKDAISLNKPGAPNDLSPQGILTSTYTFSPGEKREIVFSYRVEYPKDLPTNIPR